MSISAHYNTIIFIWAVMSVAIFFYLYRPRPKPPRPSGYTIPLNKRYYRYPTRPYPPRPAAYVQPFQSEEIRRVTPPPLPIDYDAQMKAVNDTGVHFSKQRILQPAEWRIYKLTEKILSKYGYGHYHVWAQVNLGELINTEPKDSAAATMAYAAFNSKRSDIVVTDHTGIPLAFIEYQGNSHYQTTAYQRDAIKRKAADRAGIKFVEVDGNWPEQEIEKMIDSHLRETLMHHARTFNS